MGLVRVGVCSWTDKTMVRAWYPPEVNTPAARLRYYSRFFDTAEIDSTFYALPSMRNSQLWAERTPSGFTFHVKAFAMMTRHPVKPEQLPPDMREASSLELDRHGKILHPPAEMREAVFAQFLEGVEPLKAAGKLGLVLLQFPPYFVANDANRRYIARAAELILPETAAVEFRHASWVSAEELPTTLDLLASVGAAYVSVDAPRLQGPTVLPPIAAATADVAYIRFHGRNEKTWHARVESAAQRFKYLYSEDELREWVEPIERLQAETEQTYVMFNNCYADYAPRNARQMMSLLGQVEDSTGSASQAAADQSE